MAINKRSFLFYDFWVKRLFIIFFIGLIFTFFAFMVLPDILTNTLATYFSFSLFQALLVNVSLFVFSALLFGLIIEKIYSFCMKQNYADLSNYQTNSTLDFRDFKIIGHALGLHGRINIPGFSMRYEGNNSDTSLKAIHLSIDEFFQASLNHTPSPHVVPSPDHLEIRAFQVAYNTFRASDDNNAALRFQSHWCEIAARYKEGKPIMLDCLWRYKDQPFGHYSGFLLYKDKLYSLNRPLLKCYRINMAALLLKTTAEGNKVERSDRELGLLLESLSNLPRTSDSTHADISVPEFKMLEPKLLYSKKLKPQSQGNCTYTNRKKMIQLVFIALKEEAIRLNEVRKTQTLTEAEEALLSFQTLDDRTLYKKMSTFDRFNQIDKFIERYKGKNISAEVWDPLLRYLKEKTMVNKPRSIALASYILRRLKNEKIMISDEEIAKKIASISDSQTLYAQILDFYNIFIRLGSSQQKKIQLERLKTLIFSQQMEQTIKGLQAAGFTAEGIQALKKSYKCKG